MYFRLKMFLRWANKWLTLDPLYSSPLGLCCTLNDMSVFFIGAFISHFIVRTYEQKSIYKAHAFPILLETIILFLVAIYGNHFFEGTDVEREVIIGAMLFAMGLQNSLVSTISGGLIKSSHLTGLFTDVGADMAEWIHPRTEKTSVIKNRLFVRFTVLAFYFIGALAGRYFFELFNFGVFYIIPLVLIFILIYDVSDLFFHKFGRIFTSGQSN